LGVILKCDIFIALCLANVKTSKSPGIDGLTCEHLTHYHKNIFYILIYSVDIFYIGEAIQYDDCVQLCPPLPLVLV